MHKQWEDLIPFYLNRTLPPQEAHALEQHLARCAACRLAMDEWRIVADATYTTATEWSQHLPPLSSVVRARVQGTPIIRPMPRVQSGRSSRQLVVLATAAVMTLFVVGVSLLVWAVQPRTIEPGASQVAVMASETPTIMFTETTEVTAIETTVIESTVVETIVEASWTPVVIFATATDQPPATPVWQTLEPATATITSQPTESIEQTFSMAAVEATETVEPGMDEPGLDEPTATEVLATPEARGMMQAEVQEYCYVYNASNENISLHESPRSTAEVRDVLEPGEELRIVRVNLSGWYRVAHDETRLWVDHELVETRGACGWLRQPVPTFTPTWTPTPTPTETVTATPEMLLTLFEVNPISANPGDSVILQWDIENAQRVRITAALSDTVHLDLDALAAEGTTFVEIPLDSYPTISFVLSAYGTDEVNVLYEVVTLTVQQPQ